MRTIGYYAAITQYFASITNNMDALAESFASVEPRTELDEAHIDLLITQAEQMIEAAEQLKAIPFDPPATLEEAGAGD